MEKQCRKCGAVKGVTDFYKAAGTRDGLRGECKTCHAAAKKAWYEQNRDTVIARVRRWQRENAERHNEYQRRRRADPEVKRRERDAYLKRKFGITLEQYEAMLAAQGGVCGICRRPPTEGISLHVDHDHASGRVRGLTCFRCNNALGDLNDDPELLLAAISYLDDHDPEVAEMRALAHERVAALRR